MARICLFLGAIGLAHATTLSAQASFQAMAAEDTIKQLVVRIDANQGFGSGIIFSTGPNVVYIATTNHVVRKGASEAQRIEVQFRSRPDQRVPGKLSPHYNGALDLAVIIVAGIESLGFDSAQLPFDRLGDPRALERGDPLFLLGHPNGLPWRVNTVADHFIERRRDFLDFESNLIAPGHSGGALLNGDRELIGMLKSDQAPYGEAIDILSIGKQLSTWGYDVRWRFGPVQLSSGNGRTCRLAPDGESLCWGYDARFEVNPLTLSDVRLKSIAVGSAHACGVTSTGEALCVGDNDNGELGDGSTVSRDSPVRVQGDLNFISVSAGAGHTCGIVASGAAYCWGRGSEGQLGGPSAAKNPSPVRVPGSNRFKAISASLFYSCGLTFSGRANCWGTVAGASMPTGTPVTVMAEDMMFDALTTGYNHICGLATGGAAFCWGFNDYGQFGNGSTSERYTDVPSPIAGGLKFKAVSAGVAHTCGITTDGVAYCWGANHFGQLGDGSKTASLKPSRVSGGLSFESISAGNLHTCGVTTGQVIFCWGRNEDGEVGPSGKAMHIVPWRVPP